MATMYANIANMPGHTGAPMNAQQQPDDKVEQHEQAIEEREAYEYWGYLFKPDKTGTDKLKSLLRGLKELMNINYEPSDNADLTPNQLAYFYRELHGNYDQLFLGTPSESIGFIYKSLGCLHSLQPLPQSTAFTDPTVPALKTEGWIMWQTIQLLLGPEEHSTFLMEAVQKWDVKDPATGQVFPKILPRQCFPMDADKHMVAWYEGVSERLRREADEEERMREIEAQQANVRRLHDRAREDTDDEGSVDSRGPALAYFRNPLYRHVDGRPTIIRSSSKRPTMSPRPSSMMDKGKGAATTMGHVIRNVASPHLWDGRKSESKDRRRRSSLPDNRYQYPPDNAPPASAGYDANLAPGEDRHRRRRSQHTNDRPNSGPPEEGWEAGEDQPQQQRQESRHRHNYRDEVPDATLRHSRSHEPTPSQKEYPDYFHGYDDPERANSAGHEEEDTVESGAAGDTPPQPGTGFGPSFGPSASPLFMSHLPKHAQTQFQPRPQSQQNPNHARMPSVSDQYGGARNSPAFRRTQGGPQQQQRPYSPSPGPPRNDSRRRSQEPRAHFNHSPAPQQGGGAYNDQPPPPQSQHGPPPPSSGGHHHQQPGFPPMSGGGDYNRPPSAQQQGGGYPPPGPGRDYPPQRSRDRHSSSDVSGPDEGRRSEDRERHGRPKQKQTRFAAGVDGRRYPESPFGR